MRRLLFVVAIALSVGPSSRVSAGPAGPMGMDPKAVSGIPRTDAKLEAGTVTVRCLLGDLQHPAVEVEVELELKSADGAKTETVKAKTSAEGRATFTALDPWIGGTAIARVDLDGEKLASQSMPLDAAMGTAVMLVKGASGQPAGVQAPAHGDPGAAEAPPIGKAFVLPKTPAGRLMIGTFDLGARKPIAGIDVTLFVTSPGAAPQERKGASDKNGRVEFTGLLPPELPEDTELAAAVTIDGKPQRTPAFRMDEKNGMAVVFARGEIRSAPPQRAAQPSALPGPRAIPSIPTGIVRLRVVDARDQPVVGQRVVVVKRDATGTDVTYTAQTGKNGRADVEIDVQVDALYMTEVLYGGGPWRSQFFQADERSGVAVDLRVYETTDDPTVVRSAVLFDVVGRENDLAQIVQLYDVFVAGDKAFWPQGGLHIEAPDGAKGLVVMRAGEPWLDHDEKAPYVQLAGPLPPGDANLSIAYLLEHDGEVEVSWRPPFQVVESSIAVSSGLVLTATGAQRSDEPARIPDRTLWVLGARGPGATIDFALDGLPVHTPVYRYIAMAFAIVMAGAAGTAIGMRPRRDRKAVLEAERAELTARLDVLARDKALHSAEGRRVIAALDRVHRQIDALGATSPAAKDA